jgi:hypothetical protein
LICCPLSMIKVVTQFQLRLRPEDMDPQSRLSRAYVISTFLDEAVGLPRGQLG